MQQAPFQMKCLITYYTVLPKYTLNAHKLCGRAATVVATFALACSLPEERKVLCSFKSVFQTKTMSLLVPQPRRSRPKRGEASLSLSKLLIQIVSLPRKVKRTTNSYEEFSVKNMFIAGFYSNVRKFSYQFQWISSSNWTTIGVEK